MMYFVIDPDNLTSYSSEKDASERFSTRKAAEKRANEMAEAEPGKVFLICQAVAEVHCAVNAPIIKDLSK